MADEADRDEPQGTPETDPQGTDAAAEDQPEPDPQGTDEPDPQESEDEGGNQDDTDWQAMARKWEALAKKDKKAAQALEEKVTALTADVEKAQAEALRYRVALQAGIGSVKAARRLVGTTEDELLADAKDYLAEQPRGGTPGAKHGTNGSQPPPFDPKKAADAAHAASRF